jgi:hypothetical protein
MPSNPRWATISEAPAVTHHQHRTSVATRIRYNSPDHRRCLLMQGWLISASTDHRAQLPFRDLGHSTELRFIQRELPGADKSIRLDFADELRQLPQSLGRPPDPDVDDGHRRATLRTRVELHAIDKCRYVGRSRHKCAHSGPEPASST